MRYIQIRGVDKPVSVIGLGTMIMAPDKKELCWSILDAFLAQGGTLIDTAEIYGDPEDYGYAEQTIGMWLKERQNREQIVLMSKGCIPDTCVPLHGPGLAVAPADIHRAITGSLERLQTDYLDLWLLHRDDPSVPVGEIVEALNEEIRMGRIRAYGGSNWSIQRLEAANAYAEAHGLVGMAASSPQFSLPQAKQPFFPGTTYLDETGKSWHQKNQLPVLAWSSLGRGFMKYGDPADTSRENLVKTFYSEGNFQRLARADELGSQLGRSRIDIALAYVTNQPFPSAALVGPGSVQHVLSCTGAAELVLGAEQVAWLENAV